MISDEALMQCDLSEPTTGQKKKNVSRLRAYPTTTRAPASHAGAALKKKKITKLKKKKKKVIVTAIK